MQLQLVTWKLEALTNRVELISPATQHLETTFSSSGSSSLLSIVASQRELHGQPNRPDRRRFASTDAQSPSPPSDLSPTSQFHSE